MRSCADIIRQEIASVSLHDPGSECPVHCGQRIAGNSGCISKARNQFLQRHGIGSHVAEQERHRLRTDTSCVGAKGGLRSASGNAFAQRPADGLGIVGILGNIRHTHGIIHHRRAGCAPEERDDLRPGADAVGIKGGLGLAGGRNFPSHQ